MFTKKSTFFFIFILFLALFPKDAYPESATPDISQATMQATNLLNPDKPFDLHQQLRIVGFLTILTMIPICVVMMTSFTRISIIFTFLRQALGTQQVPSTQIIFGLSIIITGFIMHPVIDEIQTKAFVPYMNNLFKDEPEVRLGVKSEDGLLLERIWKPIYGFLLQHTREKDLKLFLDIGQVELPVIEYENEDDPNLEGVGSGFDLSSIPWYCVVPSFVLSELRVAFMMGFLLFIPFLVIDMIVASILMSMGMMMLPPVMISMPFKLLLFIMIDGWKLIVEQLINGFYPMG